MFANTVVPGGVAGGVIGLHNLHSTGTPLGLHGPHSTTPTPQQLQQLQHQSSSPPSSQPNPAPIAPNTSAAPGAGELAGGQQHPRRPAGLPLYNINASNGLLHYSGYSQSSTAPLAPGVSAATAQPANTLLHRNASFSFGPHTNPQHPPVSANPASAPPSATLPPSYRSPSVNAPGTSVQALQSTPHPQSSQNRSGLLHTTANQNAHTPHSTGPDASQGQPTPPIARPPAISGSTVMPNVSSGTAPSPVTHSNPYGIGLAPHPQAATQPAQLSSGGPSGTGSGPSSSDASRFFNTYLYDYLLKQGLLDVAHVFVTSGAEMELVDGAERRAISEAAAGTAGLSHKRRRSDGSPNGVAPSSSPSQPISNRPVSEVAGSNNSNKNGVAATGNRSGASHDAPNGQSKISESLTNGPGTVTGSAGASNTSVESPRSSPRARHLSLDSLPKPKLAMDTDQGFLYEWWTIFWDVFRAKTGRGSANAQPAQLYAQNVAAVSMGLSLEHGGISKARRDAMGVLAVANPADLQKGHVSERMLQQYNMMTPQMHLGHHPEHSTPPAVRIQPPAHLLPQQKQQLFLEHNARQQHHALLLQQQQQQHQQQNQQQQQHRQAQLQQQQQAAILAQRIHQQEVQQQEAHLHHQHQIRQQQVQQMYPEQFPVTQVGPLQRSMMHNGRRVTTGMVPSGQEHITGMMPPPAVQHGSPLNPHQQPPYRSSRPPSRSGAPHVSSPFASNATQPPREPSRASNHSHSPAYQNHPRTPSSHSSAVLPQTAVLPPNRRASPGVEDPDRKKRRLNEPPGNSSAEAQAQQMQAQAHLQAQMQAHAHHQQRQMMANHALNPVSGSQASMPNPHLPQNLETYKQSMQTQHLQAIAAPNAANSIHESSPNPSGGMSPPKANGNKPQETDMPPPSSGRYSAQAPTPQSTPNGTRPAETHSTPLPRIVTPSPDRSQPTQPPRPASQNALGAGVKAGSSEVAEDSTAAQQTRSTTLPHGQEPDKPVGSSGSASAALNVGGGQSSRNPHEGDIKVQAGEASHDLWLIGSGSGAGQAMNGILGEAHDSPITDAMAPISGDIAVPSNDSLEQLFNGGDPTALEYDSRLFEAFINYDPTSTGAEFG